MIFLPVAAFARETPNPYRELAVSPDARWMAVVTDAGQLGLMALNSNFATLRLFSTHALPHLAWSPDSQQLAFVEQLPARQPAIWLLDRATGKRHGPLVKDPAWKGDLDWLDPQTLAFRTNRQADYSTVWAVDVSSRHLRRLVDMGENVEHLWAPSRSDGGLVISSRRAGRLHLWYWSPQVEQPRLLTGAGVPKFAPPGFVSFSADGRHLAYTTKSDMAVGVAWMDLDHPASVSTRSFRHSILALNILGDGRVAVTEPNGVVLWRPNAHWFQWSARHISWEQLPLVPIHRWRQKGLVAALNRSALLFAQDANHLETGRIFARDIVDLLQLIPPMVRSRRVGEARRHLASWLQSIPSDTHPDAWHLFVAQAYLDRHAKQFDAAQHHLARAITLAPSHSPLRRQLLLEQLALSLFDQSDPQSTRQLIRATETMTRHSPLVNWITHLLNTTPPDLRRQWERLGAHIRQDRPQAAASTIHRILSDHEISTHTLEGLSLITEGAFEPVQPPGMPKLDYMPRLLKEPAFQLALLGAAQQAHQLDYPAAYPVDLLFEHWVRSGWIDMARHLVRKDLSNHLHTGIDWGEMLLQFIQTEEFEPWVEDGVTRVLLTGELAPLVEAYLDRPSQQCVLQLARAKAALLAGDLAEVTRALNRFHAQTSRSITREAPNTYLTYLARLFQAKMHERAGRWQQAINAYQRCLELIERNPGYWDIECFEILMQVGLLEQGGQTDPELLRTYLITIRGMGEALVNPTHDPATVQSALTNLQTLRRISSDAWLRPYLAYLEGYCHSIRHRPAPALYWLRQARRMDPPPTLRQRILLEEAALHSLLHHHQLAAQRYEQLLGQAGLPDPICAVALQGLIQAKTASGMIRSPQNQLAALLRQTTLSERWQAWLEIQFGMDPALQTNGIGAGWAWDVPDPSRN